MTLYGISSGNFYGNQDGMGSDAFYGNNQNLSDNEYLIGGLYNQLDSSKRATKGFLQNLKALDDVYQKAEEAGLEDGNSNERKVMDMLRDLRDMMVEVVGNAGLTTNGRGKSKDNGVEDFINDLEAEGNDELADDLKDSMEDNWGYKDGKTDWDDSERYGDEAKKIVDFLENDDADNVDNEDENEGNDNDDSSTDYHSADY